MKVLKERTFFLELDMNEREMRRLEGQAEMHREWRRECAGYSEAGEAGAAESTEAAAQTGWVTCCCCETAGPPGAIVYSENDGHYLCTDSEACLWRFRELMRRWHAAREPYGPLTVYDDTAEFPF